MMKVQELKIDDRVQGGQIPDDYDTGRVVAIDGEQVTVAWDSLVETTQPAELLSPIE
jgi:hypothetical protein